MAIQRKLLHPEFLAQAKVLYYLAEGDHGTIEALNASLRRQVVANVQCKSLDIEDLSAAFVLRSSSGEALSVFGDGHPPDTREDAVNGGPGTLRTGGGGMYGLSYHSIGASTNMTRGESISNQ